MNTIYITIGVPGAGKTKWALQKCQEEGLQYLHVDTIGTINTVHRVLENLNTGYVLDGTPFGRKPERDIILVRLSEYFEIKFVNFKYDSIEQLIDNVLSRNDIAIIPAYYKVLGACECVEYEPDGENIECTYHADIIIPEDAPDSNEIISPDHYEETYMLINNDTGIIENIIKYDNEAPYDVPAGYHLIEMVKGHMKTTKLNLAGHVRIFETAPIVGDVYSQADI
tara:strand:- start:8052 stop:8726 length:675 start_codon:yes stop_codon:yes gene_type:complete